MGANSSELDQLLSLVTYRERLNYVDGLDAFRSRLERDSNGRVLSFLKRKLPRLEGRVRGGLVFVIAEHYLKQGELGALQRLFAEDDPQTKESVLDALWGEPPPTNPQMGPGIVALALEGTGHPAPEVRTAASSVIQNQCAWGVNVSAALDPLLSLLGDPSGRVRMQAACAVGNLAKRKYDVSIHVKALRLNLSHGDHYVRTFSAWALWESSRFRHDIGSAVADLVKLLASTRDNEDDNARKYASGALLHHARKSAENAREVRRRADRAKLDSAIKSVSRFKEQLAGLE